MIEKMKVQSIIVGICLTAGAMATAAYWDVDGDIELLRLAAEAQNNNRERILSWSGNATYEHRMQNGTWRADAPYDYEHTSTISFVEDKSRNAVRSNATDKTLFNRNTERAMQSGGIAVQGMSKLEPVITNTIKKEDGYYKLFGDVANSAGRQVVILPREETGADWRTNGVFSPIDLLRNGWMGNDSATKLLDNYKFMKDARSGGNRGSMSSTVRRQVVRDKNYVIYTRVDEGSKASSETIKYDLSAGGNIVELVHIDSVLEIHNTCKYEEHDGIWVLKRYEETRCDKPSSGKPTGQTIIKRIVFDDAVVNQPVNEAEFTLEKLGAMQGTLITDRRNSTVPIIYKYNIGVGSQPDQGLVSLITSRPSPGSASTAPATPPVVKQKVTSTRNATPEPVRVAVPPASGGTGVYLGIGALAVIALVIAWSLRRKQ